MDGGNACICPLIRLRPRVRKFAGSWLAPEIGIFGFICIKQLRFRREWLWICAFNAQPLLFLGSTVTMAIHSRDRCHSQFQPLWPQRLGVDSSRSNHSRPNQRQQCRSRFRITWSQKKPGRDSPRVRDLRDRSLQNLQCDLWKQQVLLWMLEMLRGSWL